MTKIDIISGFLGAGKTTLIKKLIDQAFSGEKLVLIENEFGEIGIDGGFLKEAGVEITEMNSGCICCSLVGDFGEALKKVIDDFAPDRVIIEPSGVGKLSDVMKAVEDVKEHADVVINSATTVVDVQKCKMYMKNFGEFFNNQVESAGTIVLSRTQNVDEKKINDTVALLREHNKDCAIITTPWEEIEGKVILDAMEHANTLEALIEQAKKLHDEHEHHHHHDHDEDEHEHHHHHDYDEDEDEHEHHHHHDHDEECSCGCHYDHDHHHHHHADDIFSSWGLETAKKYDKDEMKEILEVLAYESDKYGVILRAKGIVAGTGADWIYFDLVPGEYEIRDGKPDYTGKLCVIGSELKEDMLKELFKLA